jgi:putative SOS response-associated peptidase YedK
VAVLTCMGGHADVAVELERWQSSPMCNLYNLTTSQEAIRDFTRAIRDLVGNLEPSLHVWPDYAAPIVRNTPTGRELAMVRWGLPSSQKAQLDAASKRADKLRAKGKEVDNTAFAELLRTEPDGGTTNVRNTSSRHWQRWLGIENRCVVPFTAFAEPDPASKLEGGRTPNAWFATGTDYPLAFFAGIWVPQWRSVRKVREGMVTSDLYGFLTTEPNGVVAPIHQKAMPVVLTTPDEVEVWLTAPWSEAKELQQPLPDVRLRIVPEPAKAA